MMNPLNEVEVAAQAAEADKSKRNKIALAAALVVVFGAAVAFGGGIPFVASGIIAVATLAILGALYVFGLKPGCNALVAAEACLAHVGVMQAESIMKLNILEKNQKIIEEALNSLISKLPLATQARLNQTAQPSLAELAAKSVEKEAPAPRRSPRLSVSK